MKKLIIYNKVHGKFEVLIDDEDLNIFNEYCWFIKKDSQNFYCMNVKGEEKTLYLHRIIMGITDTTLCIDHIDGNGLNNQKNNLRVCSNKENLRNRKIGKNNKSGFKGVCWRKCLKKWRACIKVNMKSKYLGHFDNILDAASAYNKAATMYFGEFAKLNKIPEEK